MGNYFKIPPEWARKMGVQDFAPRHPDGWHLILPPLARKLASMLAPRDDGEPWGMEEAVAAVGGVCYTEDEALASQRGDEGYMMDAAPLPATTLYNPDGTEYNPNATGDGAEDTDPGITETDADPGAETDADGKEGGGNG